MYELDSSQLSRIHANLGLDRLRYGAPSAGAAALVGCGLPRPEAADLWYRYRSSAGVLTFIAYVRDELDTKTAELLGIDGLFEASEFDGWPQALSALPGDLRHSFTAPPI